jgi:putative membrane protein insertion efficiency factor
MNPFSRIAAGLGLAALYLYRLLVSPILTMLFGRACRFEPSCSRYAEQAIRTHGMMRGVLMAARRLARCHPLGGHGYDPVPARSGAGRE